MSGKEMRVSPGAEVGEREKGRGVKDGEELIVAVMDNEEKKETRPYTRLLLSRAVGRGNNDLGKGSHDWGRGMLKHKLSNP